jgi:hypothetical protein
MEIGRPFVIRVKPNEELIQLLESVTLGSNGARYRHLDTREKIKHLHEPLFLTLERNGKALGNVTFCRRPCGWYVRYFAFNEALQSMNKKAGKKKKEGFLKRELNTFFKNALNSSLPNAPELFYAYIDPKNVKSLWMSQNFGFKTVAKIATQTFSRVKPKEKDSVHAVSSDSDVHNRIEKKFSKHQLYFPKHTFNDAPFYGYYNENGELLAFLKTQKAKWKIERLPGKSGGVLTQIIPFIPGIRKVVHPKNHIFTTVEGVWIDDSLPEKKKTIILEELFEGVLYEENTNSLIWWVDYNNQIYKKLAPLINWGLMHKLNGVSDVDLVVLTNNSSKLDKKTPFYTTAFDFI